MRFLCTADLHVGRRSSGLPSEIRGAVLSAAECWSRVVDAAITHQVDAVLLAGDVVDEEHKFFAAYGPLERGIRRLAAEGVTTVAVAGNHDHDVLPALAREMDEAHFRCIGRGGWERITLVRERERVRVDGWSFPSRHYEGDPLAAHALEMDASVPAIGLLHCDLDQARSRYAPVSLASLRARPYAAWVLGHVHTPLLHGGRPGAAVLYPGSPQALDPGEPGVHGAWLLETGPGGVDAQQIPLSTVRYERIDLDIGGVNDAAALRGAVSRALRGALADAAAEPGALRHLSVRMRLTGRTRMHGEVERILRDVGEDRAEEGQVSARVERVENAAAPAYALEEIARGQDAPAVVASLVLSLRSGAPGDGHPELLAEVVRRIERVRASATYLPVEDRVEDSFPPHEIVEREALLLLDSLLRQKEMA